MAQKILVSLDICHSYASAAISLSGTDQNPKVLKLPSSNATVFPLRECLSLTDNPHSICGKDADCLELKAAYILLEAAQLQWGWGNSSEIDKPFQPFKNQWLLPQYFESVCFQPKLRYEMLEVLVDIMINKYIEKELKATYGDEMSSVQVEIIAVVPPYYNAMQREKFLEIIYATRINSPISVTLINRDEACMVCFEVEEGFRDEEATKVIACYMEEDITTISFLTTKKHSLKHGTSFERVPYTNGYHVLPIGSNRIGDLFQAAILEMIFDDIDADRVSFEGMCGLDMSIQLREAKEEFLRNLPNQDGNSEEQVTLRLTTLTGRRAVSYTLSPADLKRTIFEKVLAAIAIEIDCNLSVFDNSGNPKAILFSGILSECPYMFTYMEDYFENRALILDLSDGSTAACRGAILQHDRKICTDIGPHGLLVLVSNRLNRINSFYSLRLYLDELNYVDRAPRWRIPRSRDLVPFYETAAFTFMELQRFQISQMASNIMRVGSFLRNAGHEDCAVQVRKRFCAIYYQEELQNPKLDFITKPLVLDCFHQAEFRDRNIKRRNIDHVLHLATALGDCDVIEIALIDHWKDIDSLSFGHCPCNGPKHQCESTSREIGFTALYLALRRKNRPAIKLLLDRGANPNMRYLTNFAPIHAAAQWGNKKIMEMLLSKGAKTDIPYCNGENDCWYTPLHVAAEQGHEDIVVLLLETGAPHSAICRHIGHRKWPPIYFAVLRGHEDVVRILLEWGAAVGSVLDGDRTLLSIAASHGHDVVVKVLLRFGAETTNFRERIKETFRNAVKTEDRTSLKTLINANALFDAYGIVDLSLNDAIKGEEIELIRLLLFAGEDVNRAEWDQGISCYVTPLFVAALVGNRYIVQLLIDHGADIQKEIISGDRTPVRMAASIGRLETVQLLLDFGADPHIGEFSALHDACYYGNLDVVRLLLDNGMDANFADEASLVTPLRSVVSSRSCYGVGLDLPHLIVRLLLDRGADVNTTLSGGTTLLHRSLDILKEDRDSEFSESHFYFLLDKGADVNAKDDDGQTPLHYIAKVDERVQRNHDILSYIRRLVSKGANIYATDDDDRTPIDMAVGPALQELQRIQEQQCESDLLEQPMEDYYECNPPEENFTFGPTVGP